MFGEIVFKVSDVQNTLMGQMGPATKPYQYLKKSKHCHVIYWLTVGIFKNVVTRTHIEQTAQAEVVQE